MDRHYASVYADIQRWHWWFRGREQILEAVLARVLGLGRVPARRVLSVGCGPASNLAWLVPYAGEGGHVVGLDADPAGALRAGEGPPDGARVSFVVGTIEQAPLAPAGFDAVLALDVLEHLDDDAAALRAMVRLVRPGGWLLVTVPALPSLWGPHDEVCHHRRRYTEAGLRSLFARAGLLPMRVSYFNTLLFLPIAAVRWGRRLLPSAGVPQSDFAGASPGWLNGVLERLFALERHAVVRTDLPIGVSLLACARVGGEHHAA